MTASAITAEQLGLLHHTLGLRPDRREPFRNHFVAGPGHHDMPDLEALEAAGLMERGRTPTFCDQTDIVFLCTEAGKAYAIEHLPEPPKLTKYDEWLDVDGCESFAQFLGINKPVYEHGIWNLKDGEKVRMVRYSRESRWLQRVEIAGEWCKTKKDAKASYKAALNAARARP